MTEENTLSIILSSVATMLVYQTLVVLQKRTGKIWLNPMLLSVLLLISLLLIFDIDYRFYADSTLILSRLLEPAVIVLGYPLYQHLNTMKSQWKSIFYLLLCAATSAVTVSFLVAMIFVGLPEVAVSLSLKSITTPIGITLTEQLNGNVAVTAFTIILAGLFGAILGVSWLKLINVTSAKAQGLAVGAASHVLGTATISQLSYQHAAYSSLALIVSATITAIISPSLINYMLVFAVGLQ